MPRIGHRWNRKSGNSQPSQESNSHGIKHGTLISLHAYASLPRPSVAISLPLNLSIQSRSIFEVVSKSLLYLVLLVAIRRNPRCFKKNSCPFNKMESINFESTPLNCNHNGCLTDWREVLHTVEKSAGRKEEEKGQFVDLVKGRITHMRHGHWSRNLWKKGGRCRHCLVAEQWNATPHGKE